MLKVASGPRHDPVVQDLVAETTSVLVVPVTTSKHEKPLIPYLFP